MANVIISIDLKTKEKKKITVPDECCVLELKSKDLTRFVYEWIADFIINHDSEIVQIFPTKVATVDDIWRHIYTVRRGVAAVFVNEERYRSFLEKKKKEAFIRSLHSDFDINKIFKYEADTYFFLAKGVVIGRALDYYKIGLKKKDGSEELVKDVSQVFIKYGINYKEILEKGSDCRNMFEYLRCHLEQFDISKADKCLFFEKTIRRLEKLLSIINDLDDVLKTSGDESIRQSYYYLEKDCYLLLMNVYKEKNDEISMFGIAEKAQINHLETSLIFLIDYFKQKGDAIKEIECIENLLSCNPNQETHYFRRLVELGVREKNEVPPESHMNDCYIGVKRLNELVIASTVSYASSEDCPKLYQEGINAEELFDYRKACKFYEIIIYSGYKFINPFDRLMTIYRKYKMFDDEIRIIKKALNDITFASEKKIETWKKRLANAEKLRDKQMNN